MRDTRFSHRLRMVLTASVYREIAVLVNYT
jgi:hypothetical protein